MLYPNDQQQRSPCRPLLIPSVLPEKALQATIINMLPWARFLRRLDASSYIASVRRTSPSISRSPAAFRLFSFCSYPRVFSLNRLIWPHSLRSWNSWLLWVSTPRKGFQINHPHHPRPSLRLLGRQSC